MEAMVTRRGVGRVRLDARLLWLQQLCAEGVAEVRAKPGTHNEADTRTATTHWRKWRARPFSAHEHVGERKQLQQSVGRQRGTSCL